MTKQVNMRMSPETRDTLERTTRKLQQHRAQHSGWLTPARTATLTETVAIALQVLESALDRRELATKAGA